MGLPLRQSQTQIIATLGPATSTYASIRALYEAGADCFRLNFSHGTHEDHRKNFDIIRQLEKDTGAVLGIIADLQGPKLRIGAFANETITLTQGQKLVFDSNPAPGDDTRVNFPHPEIIAALKPPAQFLMDDGNVAFRVTEKTENSITAEVIYGTSLSSHKGVNVPDLALPVQTLTSKDRQDLDYALALGVDWIAQSFVQSGTDVEEAKLLIKGRAGLIAKIEKPSAVRDFKNILKHADAIMVARGDLGVEIPLEQVPAVQKILTIEAQLANKPVIIATQMLDSMRNSPRPTRAEVSDVAQAVLDGASAVMLSGETSVGAYPVQAVETMNKICNEMEKGAIYSLALHSHGNSPMVVTPFTPTGAVADKPPAPAVLKAKFPRP